MKCEQAKQLMNAYVDGEINQHENHKLQEHLDTCESCTVEFEEIKYMIQLMGEVDLKELPIGFEEELHSKLIMASNEMIIEKNLEPTKNAVDHSDTINPNFIQKITRFIRKFKPSSKSFSLAAIPLVMLLVVFATKDMWLGGTKSAQDEATRSIGFVEETTYAGEESNGELAAKSLNFNTTLTATANEAKSENLSTFTENATGATIYGTEMPEAIADEVDYREGRMIIKTSNLFMDVEKYDSVLETIKTSVEAAGGYIENENTGYNYYNSETDNLKSGSLTIRIHSEGYQSILAQVKSMGLVRSDSSSSDDITKNYRDTASEVENLKVTETRLREIMAQATTVADILSIENELTRIRGDINMYQKQLKDWEALVDMTTIYVQLNEVKHLEPSVEPIDDSLFSKAKDGFINTINQIKRAVEGFIIWFIASLPVLVILGIAIFIIWIIYRKKIKKGGTKNEK